MSTDREADEAAAVALRGTHTPPGGDDPAGASSQAALPDPDAGLFGGAIQAVAPRAPGRPAGAVNVRTNKTWQVAVSRYGDPLITSVALGNMNTLDLIRELRKLASDAGIKLGMSVGDVLAFQRACRADAMPYGHAKRAPTNEKGETMLPMIGIGTYVDARTQVAGDVISIEDRLNAANGNITLDQQLSAVAEEMSHDGKSHDDTTD